MGLPTVYGQIWPNGGYWPSTTPVALDDLTDVDVSPAPIAGALLAYNGSLWIPALAVSDSSGNVLVDSSGNIILLPA